MRWPGGFCNLNTAAEAFIHAAAQGVALGDRVAHAAQGVAMDVVAGSNMTIEILVFDRDGRRMGWAPFGKS